MQRKSIAKKVRAKLASIREELRKRMHRPIPETGQWLNTVLRGHYQYYGVPRNSRALNNFRYRVGHLWYRALRRRSDKKTLTWKRMGRIIKRWLALPRIVHPYPNQRLRLTT